MIEYSRRPAVGRMTIIAAVAGSEVVGCLTGRSCSIVAGKTGTNNSGVIDTGHRCPAGGPVTVFAQGIGLNMRRVLAGGRGAIVTAGATAGDAVVVEDCARPAVGVMTIVAAVAGIDVGRCLASSSCTIMAGRAATHYQRMVNASCRCPATGAMTVFAKIRSLYMPRRFSCSCAAVMAAETVTIYLAVIKARALPVAGCVAVFAIVSAANVAGRFSSGNVPVMT